MLCMIKNQMNKTMRNSRQMGSNKLHLNPFSTFTMYKTGKTVYCETSIVLKSKKDGCLKRKWPAEPTENYISNPNV